MPAANDYGRLKGPVLGFVIHMAEGGGTVQYLAGPNARGVSVHYVIERAGRIVQMLHEDRASGSINPRDIRMTDGPEPYGRTAAVAVLGQWANDPNSAVLSLELEGYARDGPNAAQVVSLIKLVADIRTRFPDIGLLGHRDFADYKACPGAYIPWTALGGHGPAGEDMPLIDFTLAKDEQGGTITVKPGGASVVTIDGGDRPTLTAGMVRPAMGPVFLGIRGDLPHYLVFVGTTEIGFVPETQVDFTPAPATGGSSGAGDLEHTVTLLVDGQAVYTGEV